MMLNSPAHRMFAVTVTHRALFAALLILLCSLPVNAQTESNQAKPVRLLIVMGGGTYESSVFGFFDMLDGIDHTLVMSDTEAFEQDIRDQYDAVLMYNLSRSLPEPARSNLVSFLESGGGLVVWHHALANYGDWPWWHQDVVGGRYFFRSEGDHPASTYSQDESIVASPVKPHPVVSSLGGHPMHLYDETYKGLWISDKADVLLRTSQSSSDGPLVWVGPYEAARVVVIQPGHGSGAYYNLGFRLIVRDAIHWVAGILD